MLINNINMSRILSNSLKQHYFEGKTLIDDSKHSESILLSVITEEILPYAEMRFKPYNWNVIHQKKITSFECNQILQQDIGDDTFNNIPETSINDYKNSYMSPDGGLLFVITDTGKKHPILVAEDKVQGTNDNLFSQNKKRQSTGNAIERAAKNINLAKTLCTRLDYFPYIVFASGCDFHHTETIPMRLVQMNYLRPNHYMDIGNQESTNEEQLTNIINNINIVKRHNLDIATICIKAHKWDTHAHGASNWERNERIKICKKMVDQAYNQLKIMYNLPDIIYSELNDVIKKEEEEEETFTIEVKTKK